MRPKFGVPIWLPGWPKRVWLNRLNASMRSWMRCCAGNGMFLNSDRSVRAKPGPRTLSRGVDPGSGGLGQRPALKQDGVEPLIDRVRRVVVGIAGLIGAIGQVADAERRVDHRQRETGLRLDDAVQLPAAEHVLHARARRPGLGSSAVKLTTNRWRTSKSAGPFSKRRAPVRSTLRRQS